MLLTSALGVAIGAILALTGAGGGVLAVPLLVFGAGLTVGQAAPVALLAVGLAAALGAFLGLRAGHVRYRAAALMAASGLLGAPLGAWIGEHVSNAPLLLGFAALLLVVAIRAWLPLDVERAHCDAARRAPCLLDPATGRLHWTPACARVLAGAGFLAGLLASMLGVGGGFVIVPALVRMTDVDRTGVTATSLAVIALVALEGLAANLYSGRAIAWSMAAPFAAGAGAGLVSGRVLAMRIGARRVQQSFAVLCLIVAFLLAQRGLSP